MLHKREINLQIISEGFLWAEHMQVWSQANKNKYIKIKEAFKNQEAFSSSPPDSNNNTTSCQIRYTISALLQDEPLFVKAVRRFSAEPVSQQSQALTLLHCDIQWHAVTQPQKTMFDISTAVDSPERGVCV